MKIIVFASVLILAVLSNFCFAQFDSSIYSAIHSISSDEIQKHLTILADDSMMGRKVGTDGIKKAMHYISTQFEQLGLKKCGSLNNYFQEFPMHSSIPLSKSKLLIINDIDTTLLDLSKDYFLYRSGQQTLLPKALPIVFVGYGIVAPEFDYNDYQAVDVEGKVVVFLDGEPYSEDADYFDGLMPTIYSYPESKRRIAISRGAAGTILIPAAGFNDWETIQRDFQFEDITLPYSVSSSFSILLNPSLSNFLFNGSDTSFEEILKLQKENRLHSFLLNSQIKFTGVFKENDFLSSNILGMIEGSNPDLRNTFLLISAHYDHLGTGKSIQGDSIYNGALDNAIGIAVMLELARTFSSLDQKPLRSIIFIATTGEEFGLLGATYYTENPIVPLSKTIANINIDGIAMFRDFKSIIGLGSELSTLGESLIQTAMRNDIVLQPIPKQFRNFDEFNKSDQFAFAEAGIPSLIMLEGISNQTKSEEEVLNEFIKYFVNQYHTQLDNPDNKIDFYAAAKHAGLLFDLCYQIANDEKTPEWYSGSPYINARLRSYSEEK